LRTPIGWSISLHETFLVAFNEVAQICPTTKVEAHGRGQSET
jgi:hypothetical protein